MLLSSHPTEMGVYTSLSINRTPIAHHLKIQPRRHHDPGYRGDGGPAIDAWLNGPSGLALDAAGNLFVSEQVISLINPTDSRLTSTIQFRDGDGDHACIAAGGV